jgi:hypothetical protein
LCFGISKLGIPTFNYKALLLGGRMATTIAPLLAWLAEILAPLLAWLKKKFP